MCKVHIRMYARMYIYVHMYVYIYIQLYSVDKGIAYKNTYVCICMHSFLYRTRTNFQGMYISLMS